MERLTRWTIGQIFPGITPELDLSRLQLPARAANALAHNECAVAGDLMSLTLDSVLEWRQVGVGTVDAILQALADASTSLATPTITTPVYRPPSDAALSFDAVRLPDWMSSLVDDLKLIAIWYGTVGLRGQPLLGGDVPPGIPDEVIKARQRLEALAPSDVLTEDELELDAAGWFDDALALLDPRAAQILGERLFADEPMTLDQLGQMHNVTRERIRQIEGKARGAMLSFISEEGTLATVAASARELIGTVRPLDDLLELIPALGRTVERVGQPAWRVLDRLDDAYEIQDGWCVVPTMTEAEQVTQKLLEERANQYGVIRLDEVVLVQSSQRERVSALTASWLRHCGYIVQGDFALTRTSSMGDYAAAILSIEGSALSSQEIVDRFAFERSAGSLKNAMSQDDRFERVDRDRWALAEWGMDAYAGIRSVIREAVARSGGGAKMNELVEHITGRYTVTASSVVAYATTPPFEVRDGVVRLASGEREIRKRPERTRRLFRRADSWAYRVRITTDHLRGSGSVAPVAIASILNLQVGESRQLASPLEPQLIAWTGIQPSFGTLRRFLMAEDVAAGTEAFLVINDDESFRFERARELVNNPSLDALTLVGAKPTFDRSAARIALARAIKVPDESPISSLIGSYRERGDDDVADLILAARDYFETGEVHAERSTSAEVDEIMDLL
nr:sigma factor-like helix-turn-helix DNA-binding protein [Tessaracoccus sp. OS52]